MSIKQKKLLDATQHERFLYARDFLNLDVDEANDDQDIISAIRIAQPNSDLIFVEESDQAQQAHAAEAEQSTAPQPAGGGSMGSLGGKDPRIIINIPVQETNDGTGADDVAVGVNGRVWQLKRGHDLDVPLRVAEALGVTDQDLIRHNDEGDVSVIRSKRIPFSVVQAPSIEEVQAWHAAVDHVEFP